MTTQVIQDEAKGEDGARPSRRTQLVELGVFLFLIVPSLVLSFFVARQGNAGFTLTAIATILRDLALVSLVLYFIWRNRESITAIGWTVKHTRRELVLGAILFVPVYFGAVFLERALQTAGFSVPPMPQPSFLSAQSTVQFLLAFVLVVVVALAEETIFRGYLMLRFRSITASPAAAVVLSSFIFSLGHGYEGSAGVITVGVLGAVFAVVYLWRGSLVAPITMHFLQDFIGLPSRRGTCVSGPRVERYEQLAPRHPHCWQRGTRDRISVHLCWCVASLEQQSDQWPVDRFHRLVPGKCLLESGATAAGAGPVNRPQSDGSNGTQFHGRFRPHHTAKPGGRTRAGRWTAQFHRRGKRKGVGSTNIAPHQGNPPR